MIKKAISVLCTALALTVALGVGGRAEAKSFTDSAQIQYKTAVGVMTGTGIVNGYLDGSFHPKDSVTREQAAKMVTFACIGEDAVSRLPREDTGFSDVPADRWSAPYINWCRENGLIDGVSEKSFDPEGKVTGYQLSKMLLRAVGYGQNGEYAGNSWELEAAKDGFAKGIFAGIAESEPGNYVSREDASFYLFNTLTKLEKVTYKNGAYVPADGTEALDNTFGAAVYGIVTTGSKSTVYTGTVTENSANGKKGTTVSGVLYSYETGLELLGHQAAVYTNGQKDARGRVYYIADLSDVVSLSGGLNGREMFEKSFGKRTLSADALVFDENGAVSDSHEIPGYDAAAFKAPAGSYVCSADSIIAYLPCYEEYAAGVSKTENASLRIGSTGYAAENVYCESGSLSEGDIVLARKLGEKVDVSTVVPYVGKLTDLRTERDGTVDYVIGEVVLHASPIRVESIGSNITRPSIGTTYLFYLDGEGKVFAMLLPN